MFSKKIVYFVTNNIKFNTHGIITISQYIKSYPSAAPPPRYSLQPCPPPDPWRRADYSQGMRILPSLDCHSVAQTVKGICIHYPREVYMT